ERLDAAAWSEVADTAIADIRGRGKLPVVCGGTGLYVRALLHGLIPIPDIDPLVRSQVRSELGERGPEAMHRELEVVDPDAAQRIAPRDGQRIARALEVFRATGRALTDWQAEHRFAKTRYDARVVGLWPERDVLYRRIDRRVVTMLDAGWFTEVRELLESGVPPDAAGLQTMGYRDVVACVKGQLDASLMKKQVAQSHRRYARRQLVWFRGITTREDRLVHHGSDAPDLVDALVATLETS
ncbi:MAG: tRNA (adenosine(37)-N6)-dimethylallyltransferase MiaA, partial [Myxococcota bacterium]|nr:tRNA (adenosine(37)-N6)-dimethylallyltransferase MiaA [Myxococcota bacterium]